MFDRLLGFKVHDYLQALGLLIVAVGLPLNKVLMSIGTIWLAANLLIKADFKTYWKRWKKNPVFWFIFAVFLLHIIGLLYTYNLDYAFDDLRIKLTLFVIPISLIGFPIQQRFFRLILYGFILSLLITSVIDFNFIEHHEGLNYRNYSLFGSHIRYSLLLIMGIIIMIYLTTIKKKYWLISLPCILWFLYYTFISHVNTGYVVLSAVVLGLLLFLIREVKRKIWRNSWTLLFFGLLLLLGVQTYSFFRPLDKLQELHHLPKYSANGEKYINDSTSIWMKNGHFVKICIAKKELRNAWSKRSSTDYDKTFSNGVPLEIVLIQYMASKGLTKDKEGMKKMTQQDIKNVEEGLPSIVNTYPPLRKSLTKIKSGIQYYSIGGDPDNHSLLQRFEHWKAGKSIIQENWLIGVGTGDVQDAFDQQYTDSNTKLNPENWYRAHNQFLTFWITFGIVGFLLFTGFWIGYLWYNFRIHNLLGVGFAIIAITSFLSGDTIETQKGVTFIALFLGMLAMKMLKNPKDKLTSVLKTI